MRCACLNRSFWTGAKRVDVSTRIISPLNCAAVGSLKSRGRLSRIQSRELTMLPRLHNWLERGILRSSLIHNSTSSVLNVIILATPSLGHALICSSPKIFLAMQLAVHEDAMRVTSADIDDGSFSCCVGLSSLFPLTRRAVGIRDAGLVDGTLNHLQTGLIKWSPTAGIPCRRTVRPGLVDRRHLAVDGCNVPFIVVVVVVCRFRPWLLLARRKDGVERDSEEVNDAGD